MWSVYVLKSLSSGKHYVGMAMNVENRFNEHNAGKSKFTSGHRPWKLIYSENNFVDSREARILKLRDLLRSPKVGFAKSKHIRL